MTLVTRASFRKSAGALETDHASALLVPELEPGGPQGVANRQRRDVAEELELLMAALQVVVRDPRAEVVDVVVADVPAEPLQHLRQLEERAAADRRVGVVPALAALPVGVLELVLDVEEE